MTRSMYGGNVQCRRRAVTLGVALALVGACRGQKTEEPSSAPTQAHEQRLRIVYEIDLDKAIDDRHGAIRRDLDELFLDQKIRAKVRVTLEGVTITPEDPAKKADIEALLRTDYGDTIELRACGPTDLCLHTSAAMSAAIRKAALEQAIKTIRERIDAMKIREPSVVARGEQIVVEVDADDPNAKAMRMTIARTGTLEFKVVDSGSPYMKGVYAISAEDPRARELGVQGEVDQWRVDDTGQLGLDYYFVARDRDQPAMTGRAAIEKYLAEIALRDPRYKVPDDRQIGYQRIDPAPTDKDQHPLWRSYYLERTAELTGKDVATAEGADDPSSNRPVVLVDFTRAGTRALADVTERNVGRKLATILDGTVRSAPIINGPIRGGRVSIAMGGTDPRAQALERQDLVNVLRSGALPAPLREVP